MRVINSRLCVIRSLLCVIRSLLCVHTSLLCVMKSRDVVLFVCDYRYLCVIPPPLCVPNTGVSPGLFCVFLTPNTLITDNKA